MWHATSCPPIKARHKLTLSVKNWIRLIKLEIKLLVKCVMVILRGKIKLSISSGFENYQDSHLKFLHPLQYYIWIEQLLQSEYVIIHILVSLFLKLQQTANCLVSRRFVVSIFWVDLMLKGKSIIKFSFQVFQQKHSIIIIIEGAPISIHTPSNI